jgi:Metallo-beta-lactamase superfamily
MRTTQTLTRRGLLGVGAAMPILAGLRLDVGSEANANDAPASSQPHGGGYYRFGIGGFKATVISDGYGSVPFWPIFAANQPEASTETFLNENRLGRTPQFTNNVLVVDTPTDRVLVDTGFGDVLGPASGQFPWLVQNLGRAGIPTESITTVIISHVHLDHVAGIITKSGDHVFPKQNT